MSKCFPQSNYEYLEMLGKAFVENDKETIKELLNKYIKESKNGGIIGIENDVKGYYCIDNNNEIIKIVKEKYSNKSRKEIHGLIVNNIKSAKEQDFRENIYENKIIGIKFDDKIIAVEEIRRKDWEYILYIDRDGNYYLDKMHGKVGLYTKICKIKEDDKKIIENGTGYEIEEMTGRYN
jgi:hypothetical protein